MSQTVFGVFYSDEADPVIDSAPASDSPTTGDSQVADIAGPSPFVEVHNPTDYPLVLKFDAVKTGADEPQVTDTSFHAYIPPQSWKVCYKHGLNRVRYRGLGGVASLVLFTGNVY